MEQNVKSGKSQRDDILAGLKQGTLLGVAALALILPPTVTSYPAPRQANAPVWVHTPRLADFGAHQGKLPIAPDVQRLANWVAHSGDNQNMHFVIVDKKNAHVYVFDREAVLQGDTPVLLGLAAGDDSVQGIGERPIAEVRPEERTTPAGRFIAEPGRNAGGEDVVWVDYDAAVSMHRVRALEPKERRLERLASPTTADNRISYGCINVPVAFYESVIQPAFDRRYGVVYVLPETRALEEVFAGLYQPLRAPNM